MLDFIQMDGFRRNWRRLKLTPLDMQALQVMIATAPDRAPLIARTGGLRKLRFASRGASRGKSSGLRICYAYFSKHGIVLLVRVYAKNRQENLSARECNEIKKQLEAFEKSLDDHPLH